MIAIQRVASAPTDLCPGHGSAGTPGPFAEVEGYGDCNFFHCDTVLFPCLHCLAVIGISTLRVHILGVTDHPTGPWVTQQARNLMVELGDQAERFRFLIRDRDTKFTAIFDEVFTREDLRILRRLPGLRRPTRLSNAGSAVYAESSSTGSSSPKP